MSAASTRPETAILNADWSDAAEAPSLRTGGRRSALARLAARYNTASCLAVLAAVLSYCIAEEGQFILATISIIACAAAWRLGRTPKDASERGWRPRALPKWVINLFVFLALVDAAVKVLGKGTGAIPIGAPIVSILATFLVYIQLIKLFDRRTPRDDGHVLGLSVFVVLGAILTSNALGVGVMLLAYTPLVIASAMMLQILAGYRHVWTSHAAGGASGSESGQPLLVVGPSHVRDFRRAAVGSLALIIVMATAAFLVTPRGLGENILGPFGKLGMGARIGFTDTIQLGKSGQLQNDDTPVLDVRVFDSQNQNIGEQLGTIYLRGTVNNIYDSKTGSWTYKTSTSRLLNPDDSMASEATRPAGITVADLNLYQPRKVMPSESIALGQKRETTSVTRQDITFRRGNLRGAYLFASWRPIEISGVSRELNIQRSGPEVVLKIGNDDENAILSYSVLSASEYTDPLEHDREHDFFVNSRVRELAEGIARDRGVTGDAAEWPPDMIRRAVLGFQEHLRSTCTYTRDQIPPDEGEDPIEMFLFRTQTGHCEYFASSLVAMCQSIGIDARVVAGYVAAEFNSMTGTFIVRESNAHAWAEVRLSRGRWQRFDPSPPDLVSREHSGSSGIVARLRRLYEAINITWTSAVISYDRSKQSGLMGANRPERTDQWNEMSRGFDVRNSLMNLSWRRAVGSLSLLAAIGVVVWTMRRAGSSLLRRVLTKHRDNVVSRADPQLQGLLEQATFYGKALRLLRGAGVEKPGSTPLFTHAGVVAQTYESARRDVEKLARLYYQVRFGRISLAPDQIVEASASLQRLEQRLRQDRPS